MILNVMFNIVDNCFENQNYKKKSNTNSNFKIYNIFIII